LIYQGIEEETLDQKSPGSPGWGLMQRSSFSLIIKNQEILKKTKNQASKISSFAKIKFRLHDEKILKRLKIMDIKCTSNVKNFLFITF